MDRVVWLSELPSQFSGVILANEVVDALPVDRFVVRGGEIRGVGAGWRDAGFADVEYPVEGPGWTALGELRLHDGYASEVGFQGQAWMSSLADCLASGAIVVIDYGYPAFEFYHPHRDRGTLMCHYRHRSHTDPYINVGLQDITAHVDFTALARCAGDSGLSLLGFTTQASFLLSLGILEQTEPVMLETTAESLQLAQQVKRLTLPSSRA